MRITRSRDLTVGLLAFVALTGSCRSPNDGEDAQSDGSAGGPTVEEALAQSSRWIDIYLPSLSDAGYNLGLYERRTPFLMDMNGAVVHVWADVRASGRARLLPTGHLAVITDRGRLKEFDWEGRQTWRFRSSRSSHMLHHDFARLRNGNYLVLIHSPSARSDYLLEVDRDGNEVWRWDSRESLEGDFGRARKYLPNVGRNRDLTHTNSIQELPPNRWFDEGHEEFRPGNILISARNLNALYIVDRRSGKVVWSYFDDLDWPHEARMVPAGFSGEGHIQVFNNRYHSIERQTRVVELNPVEGTVVWSYSSPRFFSATGGTQQALANGNLLVTSSQGGRVFEVTREGQIVWQWTPGYLPMRVLRYPEGYCPQLESLGSPSGRKVLRRDPERFIDRDAYSVALTHDVRRGKTADSTVLLLKQHTQCRQVLLPEDATLRVGYGVEGRERCEGDGRRLGHFGLSIRPTDAEVAEDLLERTVGLESFEEEEDEAVHLRREELSLARFGGRSAELCLRLSDASGGPAPPCFVWEAPWIRTAGRSGMAPAEEEQGGELLEHERQQLEALGYIN